MSSLSSYSVIYAFVLACLNNTPIQAQCSNEVRHVLLTDVTGYLASPSYPRAYQGVGNCQWLIDASAKANASIVSLVIDTFSTAVGVDNVSIYDGDSQNSSLIAQISGTYESPLRGYASTQQFMFVKFEFSSSQLFRGFTATYTLSIVDVGDACFEIPRDISTSTGTITAHRNFSSDDPIECHWRIRSVNQFVTIDFIRFNVTNGFIELYDGPDMAAGNITTLSGVYEMGTEMPGGFTTTQLFLYVRYYSNGSDPLPQEFIATFRSTATKLADATAAPTASDDVGLDSSFLILALVTLFVLIVIITTFIVYLSCRHRRIRCKCKCRRCTWRCPRWKTWFPSRHTQDEPTPVPPQSPPPTIANDNNDCAICFEKPQNAVLFPCRHGSYCIECATEVFNSTQTCPTCRQLIESVEQVFR